MHTPTLEGLHIEKVKPYSDYQILDCHNVLIADAIVKREHARLIVQAVNAHERLKDALVLLTDQLNRDFDMADDDRVTEQLAQAYINARALLAELGGKE